MKLKKIDKNLHQLNYFTIFLISSQLKIFFKVAATDTWFFDI